MTAKPVEWVLAIYYGPSAHRAAYGRLDNTKYTKDYIQLSQKPKFLAAVSGLFPLAGGEGSVPLTYQWPAGSTDGSLVFRSADRPHLKWKTAEGPPQAWKMTLNPSPETAETIPGDPTHTDFDAAENEFALLVARGAGEPYLFAIKLRDEPNRLHLRVHLKAAAGDFAWASLGLTPRSIQSLALQTSQKSALAWSSFTSGGVPPSTTVTDVLERLKTAMDKVAVVDALDAPAALSLAAYLRNPGYGLFFEPTKNHNAWLETEPIPVGVAGSVAELLTRLDVRFPPSGDEDAAAEEMEVDPNEVKKFEGQIETNSFEVPDLTATTKTRGSAQRAFAGKVKSNYGFQCAVTGIATTDFLVAAHIVPWSKDQSIRLDPSNGICLSLIVDRAFEKGYVLIDDDYTVRVVWDRIGTDDALREHLAQYDGQQLRAPTEARPKTEYLQRRRGLIGSDGSP